MGYYSVTIIFYAHLLLCNFRQNSYPCLNDITESPPVVVISKCTVYHLVFNLPLSYWQSKMIVDLAGLSFPRKWLNIFNRIATHRWTRKKSSKFNIVLAHSMWNILSCSYWLTDLFSFVQIIDLSRRYPGLMSLRSVDLSPASWMAVAWSVPRPFISSHKRPRFSSVSLATSFHISPSC